MENMENNSVTQERSLQNLKWNQNAIREKKIK